MESTAAVSQSLELISHCKIIIVPGSEDHGIISPLRSQSRHDPGLSGRCASAPFRLIKVRKIKTVVRQSIEYRRELRRNKCAAVGFCRDHDQIFAFKKSCIGIFVCRDQRLKICAQRINCFVPAVSRKRNVHDILSALGRTRVLFPIRSSI